MNSVIKLIEKLKKDKIRETIESRMQEFENIGRDYNNLFRELAFCILAAGTSAELGMKTVDYLGETIFHGTKEELQKKLKEVYRFHTIRAGYLFDARNSFKKINLNANDAREQLVKNIKGIGMKEASHFLRNIGYKDYAIIDFHIIDFLVKNKLIKKSKTITPKKYLEIEKILKEIAKKTNLSLGELDLYLWYHETGKVLK